MSSTPDSDRRKTILYIEDDQASRTLVRRVMELAGYRVLTAHDGLLGIDAARQHLPDLILMDINLPHMSGEAVTTRLRSMAGTRDIPIVALTAQASGGDRERALVAGCAGYITKPIDVDGLPATVVEYLNGRRDELSSNVARRYHAEYSQSLVARLEAKVRQLEAVNRELRRLDKMKNDFIALTSHELRTPLTLVEGYARLLDESGKELGKKQSDSDLPALIESTVLAVDRLHDIIHEILSVARIAVDEVEPLLGPLDFQRVMDSAVEELMEASLARSITLSVASVGWPDEVLLGDEALLKIAFRNLLGNALKYTPDGGKIRVEAREVENALEVVVKDNGIGIDPDEQSLIFEQFYTANNVERHSTSKTGFMGGGLGLGLAIAKGVVTAHGGQIWVESTGRDEETLPGSQFYILLPLRRVSEMAN